MLNRLLLFVTARFEVVQDRYNSWRWYDLTQQVGGSLQNYVLGENITYIHTWNLQNPTLDIWRQLFHRHNQRYRLVSAISMCSISRHTKPIRHNKHPATKSKLKKKITETHIAICKNIRPYTTGRPQTTTKAWRCPSRTFPWRGTFFSSNRSSSSLTPHYNIRSTIARWLNDSSYGRVVSAIGRRRQLCWKSAVFCGAKWSVWTWTMREGYESSYGWSNTDEDGWDPRYYFTYYTTLGHRSGSKMCAETILFVVILVMSLLANVAIITAILRYVWKLASDFIFETLSWSFYLLILTCIVSMRGIYFLE